LSYSENNVFIGTNVVVLLTCLFNELAVLVLIYWQILPAFSAIMPLSEA